jgi:hypothetical protein
MFVRHSEELGFDLDYAHAGRASQPVRIGALTRKAQAHPNGPLVRRTYELRLATLHVVHAYHELSNR